MILIKHSALKFIKDVFEKEGSASLLENIWMRISDNPMKDVKR